MGTAIKHPVPDWVLSRHLQFLTSGHSDAGTPTLGAERQSARMSKITNGRLNPIWHMMLYSCTPMATVGVEGVIHGPLLIAFAVVAKMPAGANHLLMDG